MEYNRSFSAKAKKLPMSAKKVRPVADNVRGLQVDKARAILSSMPNKGAKLLNKVVKSAASNAMFSDDKLDESSLFVKTVMIDEGPSMKRIWPRARGRADKLIKRSCHIFVEVDKSEDK